MQCATQDKLVEMLLLLLFEQLKVHHTRIWEVGLTSELFTINYTCIV